MRKLKVALIGTHGTGKTTLTHELVCNLKKQGINAEFLGELARQCPLPINEDATEDSQEWIIYNQYIKELESKDKCDLLICDRSILDGYVYYTNKFQRNLILEQFMYEKIKTYDLLIKVPVREGFLRADGIRSVNEVFQKEIDKRFDLLLNDLRINHLVFESVEQVIEEIKRLFKDYKSL